MNDQSPQQNPNEPERPAPRPFPNSDYVRPGIDDRPDLDKALTDEDKAAVARLAVRQKPKTPPAAADQPEVQAAAMGVTAPVGGADEPVPDLESAFLDMRDPMVDANGDRPTKTQILRMKIGFACTAFFLALALAALNITLVPQELDALSGPVGGAIGLAWVLGVGIVCSFVATIFFLPLSDHTRTPFGRRAPWFAGGTILSVIFAFALSACHAPAAVGIVWAIMQIGIAATLCSLHASLGERVPDKFRDAVGRWRTVGLLAGLVCGIWLGVLMAHNPAEGMDLCAIGLLIAGIVGLFVIPRESSTVYSRARPMTNDDLLVTLRVPHPTRAWRMICFTRLFASAGAVLAIAFVWFVVRYLHGAGEGLDVRATMIMVALMGLLACAMALLSEGVTDLIRSSAIRPPACMCSRVSAGSPCTWSTMRCRRSPSPRCRSLTARLATWPCSTRARRSGVCSALQPADSSSPLRPRSRASSCGRRSRSRSPGCARPWRSPRCASRDDVAA